MAGDARYYWPTHSSGLQQAAHLFYAGEYSQCIEILRSEPRLDAYLLQARALYRLQRYHDALALLKSHSDLCVGDDDAVAWLTQCAVLLKLVGSEQELEHCIAQASLLLRRASTPARSEAALNLALVHWMRDDPASCEQSLSMADGSAEPNHAATALAIRALLASSRRAYDEQAKFLKDSLTNSLRAPLPDVGFIANSLHALAALCREIYVPDAVTLVTNAAKTLPWTGEVALNHFQTLRCLAWSYALQGEYITAIRFLNKAQALTNDRHRRMLALLDRAWIGDISGERHTAGAALSDADEIIRGADWYAAAGEESAALLVAAELFASRNTRRAREILALFADVRGNISASYSFAHDDRLRALYDYATALVLFADSAVSSSRRHAKAAYETFSVIGYRWRAARCALLLYRGGAGSSWLDKARKTVKPYPRSFVAEDLRICVKTEAEVAVGVEMTPRRQQIVKMLCDGLSVEKIAQELKSRPNTVRVHIQRLHRDLGVHNRIELVRKIAAMKKAT